MGLVRTRLAGAALIVAGVPATFFVVNFVHFEYFPVRVVLYACVLDALIASALVAAAGAFIARGTLDRIDTGLSFMLANAIVLLYSIMGPTVIDRSLSLYIVEKVEQRGGQVSEAAMDDIFIHEYLPEFRVVDVRLTEQLQSGTLRRENGCLRLTERGAAIAAFAKWYRRTLLPRRRVVLGEETDELRRPFEHGTQNVNVACDPAPERRAMDRD